MSASTATCAAWYAVKGLTLTWTPRGAKGPRHNGWNDEANAIKEKSAANQFWTAHPDYGIGALLSFSGLVSLDIDHLEHSRTIFRQFGVDLDDLRKQTPCVIGNPAKFRAMYQAPATELRHRTLAWPKRECPSQGFAVFELRAGPISDALPPTIHVGTGKPYRWENPPRHGFPALPARILELWQDWPEFSRKALALCPWAPAPKEIPPQKARAELKPGESIISAFNSAHDVVAILEAHNYQRRGKRFTKPESQHHAGIVLTDSGKVFCHHQGDVLSSEHALDAFDCYRLLEHNGDFRSAVKTAAKALGLDRKSA